MEIKGTNQGLIEIIVKEGVARIKELCRWQSELVADKGAGRTTYHGPRLEKDDCNGVGPVLGGATRVERATREGKFVVEAIVSILLVSQLLLYQDLERKSCCKSLQGRYRKRCWGKMTLRG